MTNELRDEASLSCRKVRKQFVLLQGNANVTHSAKAVNAHLQTCSNCALEYRLFALQRATLDAAASAEPVTPDEQFFSGLRARIARGPALIPSRRGEESWTAALLLTARQLVPAMAVLP